MSISTISPAFVLLFAIALLWILMDLHIQDLTSSQKKWFPAVILLLAILNHLLKLQIGGVAYGKTILFSLHLPVFVIYRNLAKCNSIKMVFMILSAFIFSAPIVLSSTLAQQFWPENAFALAVCNLLSSVLVLIMAHFMFRSNFSYLIRHGDNRLILRFSMLPLLYYIYIAATLRIDPAIWERAVSNVGVVIRVLPTIQMLLFYFFLFNNFQDLSEKREINTTQAALTQQLNAAEEHLAHLSETQMQTAIYQHDMRHHLNAISAYLSSHNSDKALAYIQKVQSDVETISPKRFCENEIFNLMCSSFASEAEHLGVRLSIHAKLPKHLPIPDPELCAILSNGLENSLNAVFELPESLKWVDLYCEMKLNKLLLEIRNPYLGEVIIRNDLPESADPLQNHGYGSRSIRSIVNRHNGLCIFEPRNGIFTLRVVIPLQTETH